MNDIIVNTPKRLRDLSRTKLVETIERQQKENAEFLETMRQRFEHGKRELLKEMRWTAESRNRLLSYTDDLQLELDTKRALLEEHRRLDRISTRWTKVLLVLWTAALFGAIIMGL